MSTDPRRTGLRKRVKPFTSVPNETIEDWTIGYRELGLLVRILRMPEGFVIRSEQLANEGKGRTRKGRKPSREGREAVRTALRKLAVAGYYRLEKVRWLDGSFTMRNSVSEEPDPLWAEQAAAFDGRAVPLYEQEPGDVFVVKYPDGTTQPDGFPPPDQAVSSDDAADDYEQDEDDAGDQTPETGFRAPGSRAPVNPASGEAEPGRSGALKKMVSEDGHQDSVPASQVRRGDAQEVASSRNGQITIYGKTEPLEDGREPTENDLAMGIARGWVKVRTDHECPIVMRGRKSDPMMALHALVLPALRAGYAENEIKNALAFTDTGIPSSSQLDSALTAVRGGWRPARGWKPGSGRGGGGGGGFRQGRRSGADVDREWSDVRPSGAEVAFAGASTGGASGW